MTAASFFSCCHTLKQLAFTGALPLDVEVFHSAIVADRPSFLNFVTPSLMKSPGECENLSNVLCPLTGSLIKGFAWILIFGFCTDKAAQLFPSSWGGLAETEITAAILQAKTRPSPVPGLLAWGKSSSGPWDYPTRHQPRSPKLSYMLNTEKAKTTKSQTMQETGACHGVPQSTDKYQI